MKPQEILDLRESEYLAAHEMAQAVRDCADTARKRLAFAKMRVARHRRDIALSEVYLEAALETVAEAESLTPAQQAAADALDLANNAFGKIQEIGEADPLYAVKKKAAMATRRVRRKEWEATWPETNTPELHHEIRECRDLQAIALNELALAEYNAAFPAK